MNRLVVDTYVLQTRSIRPTRLQNPQIVSSKIMVCPLRFVLAGLSAAIVLFLAFDMLWGSGKQDDLLLSEQVCIFSRMQTLSFVIVSCSAVVVAAYACVVLSSSASSESAPTRNRVLKRDRRRVFMTEQCYLYYLPSLLSPFIVCDGTVSASYPTTLKIVDSSSPSGVCANAEAGWVTLTQFSCHFRRLFALPSFLCSACTCLG